MAIPHLTHPTPDLVSCRAVACQIVDLNDLHSRSGVQFGDSVWLVVCSALALALRAT